MCCLEYNLLDFFSSLLQPLILCWVYSKKCSVELGKSFYLLNWQKLSRKPQSSSPRCVPFESYADTSHWPPIFKHNQLLFCFTFIGWKRERPKYTLRVTNKAFLIWLAVLVPVVLSMASSPRAVRSPCPAFQPYRSPESVNIYRQYQLPAMASCSLCHTALFLLQNTMWVALLWNNSPNS